jgi:hypothetical protein
MFEVICCNADFADVEYSSKNLSTLKILVNVQLDAQFFFLYVYFNYLHVSSKHRAHHQENQLYQQNIWYASLCVGDRLVCRSGTTFPTCTLDGHLHRVTHTGCCIDTIDSPNDEHEIARNLYRNEINTQKKELCVKLVFYKNCQTNWNTLYSRINILWSRVFFILKACKEFRWSLVAVGLSVCLSAFTLQSLIRENCFSCEGSLWPSVLWIFKLCTQFIHLSTSDKLAVHNAKYRHTEL